VDAVTISDLLAVLSCDLHTSDDAAILANARFVDYVQRMGYAERDTLVKAFKAGPLRTLDVPSQEARDTLLSDGLLSAVVVAGDDDFVACTHKGMWACTLLRALYVRPGYRPDAQSMTCDEAVALMKSSGLRVARRAWMARGDYMSPSDNDWKPDEYDMAAEWVRFDEANLCS
jgi:hypothetical protein